MTDTTVTITLEADEAAALDRYRSDIGPSASRSDALASILRDWISQSRSTPGDSTGTVDEGMSPSQLNSSNDI